MVDAQIALRLQPYLLAGERLTWTGRPPGGLMFHANDVLLAPFSVLWGGFAIFWETTVLKSSTPGFFAVWGVPFIVIGLYVMIGRFFVDAWVRRRTVYALTNQRALVLRRFTSEKLLAEGLALAALERGRGDRGTLRFGRRSEVARSGSWFGWGRAGGWEIWQPALNDRVEFIQIDDVMTPYRLAVPQTSPP